MARKTGLLISWKIMEIRDPVGFPQPPAEGVIRSEEGEVAGERRVRADIRVASGVGSCNVRLARGMD